MPSTPSTLRRQVAIVRSVLDQIERWVADGTSGDSVRVQLLEELSRLEREVRAWVDPSLQPEHAAYAQDAAE
jgi:hypothetical protein